MTSQSGRASASGECRDQNIQKPEPRLKQSRSVQVACGVVTVRKDAGNFSSRTFAYVVDDDKLWLTGMEEWLKEPQEMGVVRVMKYCPGN